MCRSGLTPDGLDGRGSVPPEFHDQGPRTGNQAPAHQEKGEQTQRGSRICRPSWTLPQGAPGRGAPVQAERPRPRGSPAWQETRGCQLPTDGVLVPPRPAGQGRLRGPGQVAPPL